LKLPPSEQRIVNDFMREHVDHSYKVPMNAVRLSAEHTDAHRRMIFEVCNYLLSQGIPFFTEVRLKCGCIPDIVVPTHITPFIEVLSTETMEMFEELKLGKYPDRFQERYNSGRLKYFTFISARNPFNPDELQ